MQINICEAKTQLSQLVEAAHRSQTVIIAKAGTPMAKPVPLGRGPKRQIQFGLMKGNIDIADDFDAPLPDDLLRSPADRDKVRGCCSTRTSCFG